MGEVEPGEIHAVGYHNEAFRCDPGRQHGIAHRRGDYDDAVRAPPEESMAKRECHSAGDDKRSSGQDGADACEREGVGVVSVENGVRTAKLSKDLP